MSLGLWSTLNGERNQVLDEEEVMKNNTALRCSSGTRAEYQRGKEEQHIRDP